MGVVRYSMGDQVIVDARREELVDIGVISDTTMKWLLDGTPKKVERTIGKQVYLVNEESPSHMIWVYSGMVYKKR